MAATLFKLVFMCVGLVQGLQEALLHENLFKSYNKNVRPVYQRNTTTNLTVNIYYIKIETVDLLTGNIAMEMSLDLIWKDELLAWNRSQYDNIDQITVDCKDIWLPDIVIADDRYSVNFIQPIHFGRASVTSDGKVYVWPVIQIDLGFKVFVSKYPFDIHSCYFELFSWSLANHLLSFRLSNKLQLSQFHEVNGQWNNFNIQPKHNTHHYDEDDYDYLGFSFTLERKWLYYIVNIMAPVVITSALNVFCFVLPSESGERITLCISIFLALAVFLGIVNSALPQTSDGLSILAVYIGLQLLGSALTIIMTTITLNLFHRDGEVAFPAPVTKLLRRFRFNKRGMAEGPATEVKEKTENKALSSCKKTLNTWRNLSHSLNKLCFYMSLLWNVCLMVIFFIVVKS